MRESFKELVGLELLEGYGRTEAAPVVSLNPPGSNRPGSVGLPLPGAEMRVLDDSGQVLPADSIGDIQVRGPMVMASYHGPPEETSEVLSRDGWLATGDRGYLNADGFLWLKGRRKEMMKVGGEQVYPAEIEDCLSQHPAVAEVGVTSIDDERRGESPKALVVKVKGAQVTAEELRRFCRERLLPFKVPPEIEFVDELPKGHTGKVDRRRLKEREERRRGKLGFVIDRVSDGSSGPVVRVGCAEDLEGLRAEGLVAVVSLTEASLDRGEVEWYGFEYEHRPIPDFGRRTREQDMEQVGRFVGLVRRVRQEDGGRSVRLLRRTLWRGRDLVRLLPRLRGPERRGGGAVGETPPAWGHRDRRARRGRPSLGRARAGLTLARSLDRSRPQD